MKYLGIDFGSKRVGVAVSDDEGKMAFPHSVILNNDKLLAEMKKIIESEKIEGIVMGESKNFAGRPNVIMKEIINFSEILEEKFKIQIFFEPEFMTSQQAEHLQGKNEMHDASAAAIILQSYLDKNSHML